MTAAVPDASLQAWLCAALQPLAAAVRPENPADLPFCAVLYALTRAEELAQAPWTDEMKQAFCLQQFNTQHQFYRQTYPEAQFFVIERAGTAIGRVYVDPAPGEERLMEITVLHEARGQGIGSAITRAVVARAHGRGVAASLHVEPMNPARRLYERVGFREVETQGFYLAMRCEPPSTNSSVVS